MHHLRNFSVLSGGKNRGQCSVLVKGSFGSPEELFTDIDNCISKLSGTLPVSGLKSRAGVFKCAMTFSKEESDNTDET